MTPEQVAELERLLPHLDHPRCTHCALIAWVERELGKLESACADTITELDMTLANDGWLEQGSEPITRDQYVAKVITERDQLRAELAAVNGFMKSCPWCGITPSQGAIAWLGHLIACANAELADLREKYVALDNDEYLGPNAARWATDMRAELEAAQSQCASAERELLAQEDKCITQHMAVQIEQADTIAALREELRLAREYIKSFKRKSLPLPGDASTKETQ
jgi:hypothetical protein